MDESGEADILLIDANPADAELALRALRRAGIGNDLIWIDDGARALDFLLGRRGWEAHAAANLGLVLLEVRLPRVDGIELLKRIRADERARPVPVVMLTASAVGREVSACYRFGANSFLVKPASATQFSELICQASAYWIRMNRTPWREARGELPLSPA
jgi:CheY-like chemotaxis protein